MTHLKSDKEVLEEFELVCPPATWNKNIKGGEAVTIPMEAANFIHDRDTIKSFLIKIRQEDRREIEEFILPKVEKFINKVESGRARSKETYADMLEIRAFLNSEDKV